MPLSGAALKTLIMNNLTALGRPSDKIDQSGIEAIANAIVQHITTSAVVTVTTTDITACPAGSGTGTGTGTGTVT